MISGLVRLDLLIFLPRIIPSVPIVATGILFNVKS